MKTENLKVGMTIKNYKQLCEILGIEAKKTGSNSHKAQIKEFERYFNYEKQGHKYIITKIHDSVKVKVDNRKDNKGGNNMIFAEDIEKILLNLLHKSNDGTLTISRGQLYKALAMCNDNYLIGRSNISKLSEITEIKTEAIYEFYDCNSTKLRDTVERALKRLRSKALATWKNTITVAVVEVEIEYNCFGEPVYDPRTKGIRYKTKEVHRVAEKYEEQTILHCEKLVLQEMGIDSMQKVFLIGKWKYFKQQVEKKLQENNTNIKYYYDTYTITFNDSDIDNVNNSLEFSVEEVKNNINENMIKSISKSNKTRHTKAINNNSFGSARTDKLNYQASDNYIHEQEQLTFLLIDKNNTMNLKKQFENNIDYKKLSNINAQQLAFDEEIPF